MFHRAFNYYASLVVPVCNCKDPLVPIGRYDNCSYTRIVRLNFDCSNDNTTEPVYDFWIFMILHFDLRALLEQF